MKARIRAPSAAHHLTGTVRRSTAAAGLAQAPPWPGSPPGTAIAFASQTGCGRAAARALRRDWASAQ